MTRHIDFEGIENFRDFGGYDTAAGRRLKAGVLYRSANHHRATDADLERMRAMGIAAIVDLRRSHERSREPSRRWPGFEGQVIENDIDSIHPDWVEGLRGADLTPAWFHSEGLKYYRTAPFEACHVDLYSRYFQALAQAAGALVVHCAAGKDRTGMICALTHHIAGVHPDDIMSDFLLTNDESRMDRKIERLGDNLERRLGKRPPAEALRVAVSVHPEFLETAFATMRATHGSLEGYLSEVLGVDAALRARLEARLLA